jgi:hypothetical protein
MADAKTNRKRSNRVFKSLHKPLTYLGVERTVFYLICVSAVGAFNLFNSILAGIAVFIGGFVRISFPRLIRVCDQLCNPLILPLGFLSSKASSVDRDQAPDRTTFNFDDFLKPQVSPGSR